MLLSLSLLATCGLVSTLVPLARLWLSVRGTALRSAACWVAFATLVWTALSVANGFEPVPGDWSWLGHLRLVAATAALAPLIAPLGARRPGETAWNWIVLSLLAVFLLMPVLEQWLVGLVLDRPGVLDTPRFALYWLVASVGIVNYLPTRFGPSAVLVTGALAFQTAIIGPWTLEPTHITLLGAVAALEATGAAWLPLLNSRPNAAASGLDTAWLRFRDAWGLVWASRVRDRWNAEAEHYELPLRLRWRGFVPVEGAGVASPEQLEIADRELRLLLKRFVDPAEILDSK